MAMGSVSLNRFLIMKGTGEGLSPNIGSSRIFFPSILR